MPANFFIFRIRIITSVHQNYFEEPKIEFFLDRIGKDGSSIL